MTEPRDPVDDWLAGQHIDLLPPPPGAYPQIKRVAARRRRWKAVAATAGVVTAVAATTIVAATAFGGRQQQPLPADSPTVSPTVALPPVPSPSPSTPPPSPRRSLQSRPSQSTTSRPPTAPVVTACTLADLGLSAAADAGGGTAGSSYIHVTFKNTTKTACTLSGFPTAVFITAAGQTVGSTFRHSGTAGSAVRLAPASSAHVTVRIPATGPYGDTCQATTVSGIRISLTGQKPRDVTTKQTVCSADGVGTAELTAVTAGAS